MLRAADRTRLVRRADAVSICARSSPITRALPAFAHITIERIVHRCDNDRFFSHRAGDAGRQLGVIYRRDAIRTMQLVASLSST